MFDPSQHLGNMKLLLGTLLQPSAKSINWVAVKELRLRDYPPIKENQMEKKMEHEMETGGI